jgi:hypothetical protein
VTAEGLPRAAADGLFPVQVRTGSRVPPPTFGALISWRDYIFVPWFDDLDSSPPSSLDVASSMPSTPAVPTPGTLPNARNAMLETLSCDVQIRNIWLGLMQFLRRVNFDYAESQLMLTLDCDWKKVFFPLVLIHDRNQPVKYHSKDIHKFLLTWFNYTELQKCSGQ